MDINAVDLNVCSAALVLKFKLTVLGLENELLRFLVKLDRERYIKHGGGCDRRLRRKDRSARRRRLQAERSAFHPPEARLPQ